MENKTLLICMSENNIKDLLRKYLEGTATPEEEMLVDEWYDSLSDKGALAERLSDSERRSWRNVYWNSLSASIGISSAFPRKKWSQVMAIAACAAVISLLCIFYFPSEVRQRELKDTRTTIGVREIINDGNDVREIILPDSSNVKLSPGSKLTWRTDFNTEERKINLLGEAFFDIRHNEEKPFFVFTNEVVTKVLGTSFSIKAYPEDRDITVAVISGKVSVYPNIGESPVLPEARKVILTPNQQAVYKRSDKKVLRMLVKDPAVIIPEEEVNKIRFEGAPISEIFKALEKMYGVEIMFKEKIFDQCFITTSVSEHNLYEKIDVICEITGSTYKVQDARIEISGPGCD